MENKRFNLKKSKGVTLLALVITIIIMLILAAITLRIMENSGLLDKSKEAKEKYNAGAEDESKKLGNMFGTRYYLNGDSSNTDMVLILYSDTMAIEDGDGSGSGSSGGEIYYKIENGKFYIKFDDDSYSGSDSYYSGSDSYYNGSDSYYSGSDSYYSGSDSYSGPGTYAGDGYYEIGEVRKLSNGTTAVILVVSGQMIFADGPLPTDDVTLSGTYTATIQSYDSYSNLRSETLKLVFNGKNVEMHEDGDSYEQTMSYQVSGDMIIFIRKEFSDGNEYTDSFMGTLVFDENNEVKSILMVLDPDDPTVEFTK